MGQKNNVSNETHVAAFEQPSRDEWLRITALDRALQNVPTGAPSEIVLQRAKAYEDFLRNGEQEKTTAEGNLDSPFVSEASEATKNVVNGYSEADPFGGHRVFNISDETAAKVTDHAERLMKANDDRVWNSAIDAVFALGGDRSNNETFDLGTIRNAVKGLYRK